MRASPAVAVGSSLLLAAAAAVLAAPARADGPATGPRDAWRARRAELDPYVPSVPVNDSRAAFVVPATPITPFLGSQGEAGTPRRGQFSVLVERLSDERTLRDVAQNLWVSDGEVQLTRFEVVSPRWRLGAGAWCVPFHAGATLQAYSLHGAWFDGLRNWVEETFLAGDPPALGHDLGGRALEVRAGPAGTTTEVLGGWPMAKAKAFAKFPLPDLCLLRTRLSTALSVGVGTPAFGSHRRSGNSSFQPEAVLAWGLPFGRFRWTGAGWAAWSGGTDLSDDVGLRHEDWVLGAHTNLEWWPWPRFAAAVGVSWASAWTRDSGLPTDLDSAYVNVGLLWRIDGCSDLQLTFSENPEGHIINTFGADYSDSQKEADFTLALGFRRRL
jgi:hypothetical protein